MAADRARCWVLVLLLVGGVTRRGAWAAPGGGGSLGCGREPENVLRLGDRCTCDIGCDAERNLLCVHGVCVCQPDSVLFNQTCLLKGHYNESCRADVQCPDPHQHCEPTLGRCLCRPGFTEAVDDGGYLISICRPAEDHGRLGDNCSSVVDCNWRLQHVGCPLDLHVCSCQAYYHGETGGLVCTEQHWTISWAWWTALCLIAVIVIAAGLALITSCTVKECYRSHRRARSRVIAVTGPMSEHSPPPPPYVAVISSKPPAYAATEPEKNCMDNYGFSPCGLEPYSERKH